MTPPEQNTPWLDVRLSEEVMQHLWDMIDSTTTMSSQEQKKQDFEPKNTLAGNISKSEYFQDTDNWFFETILKEMSEYMFFRNSWKNYFNVVIVKQSPLVFELKRMWVNYQKQHEFNPPHKHSGEFSFVVFMKIPTHWKEQHALSFSANSNTPCASDFQFLLGQGRGPVESVSIPLSPEDEGRILFFPAWLLHQVFPFYGTEEERITISGNIQLVDVLLSQKSLKDEEIVLENLERQVDFQKRELKELQKMIKKEKENDEKETNSERS